MEMTVKQLLQDGRDLITPRKAWTQGKFARNQAGEPVSAISKDAVCWCSDGALDAVAEAAGVYDTLYPKAYEILSKAAGEVTGQNIGIICYNDTYSHEQVLFLWDRAIANA